MAREQVLCNFLVENSSGLSNHIETLLTSKLAGKGIIRAHQTSHDVTWMMNYEINNLESIKLRNEKNLHLNSHAIS